MKTIWKFTLKLEDHPSVMMPDVSETLHVGMQGGEITLWAKVDPASEKVCRTFRIVGTGNPFPNDLEWSHIGTVFDGPFVWHVFE